MQNNEHTSNQRKHTTVRGLLLIIAVGAAMSFVVAYPFVGFKSPTVFVCKKEVKVCKYIDSNKKAVNLIKQLGELKPGKYRLCRYLTKKLQTFYNKHYLEIKDSISVKENPGGFEIRE